MCGFSVIVVLLGLFIVLSLPTIFFINRVLPIIPLEQQGIRRMIELFGISFFFVILMAFVLSTKYVDAVPSSIFIAITLSYCGRKLGNDKSDSLLAGGILSLIPLGLLLSMFGPTDVFAVIVAVYLMYAVLNYGIVDIRRISRQENGVDPDLTVVAASIIVSPFILWTKLFNIILKSTPNFFDLISGKVDEAPKGSEDAKPSV